LAPLSNRDRGILETQSSQGAARASATVGELELTLANRCCYSCSFLTMKGRAEVTWIAPFDSHVVGE
jgi:hypothetical protein